MSLEYAFHIFFFQFDNFELFTRCSTVLRLFTEICEISVFFFFISMKVSGKIIVHLKSREKGFLEPGAKSYCVIYNTHHK